MGKFHIILVAFFAVAALTGSGVHGYSHREIPSTHERQSTQHCPDTYHNGKYAQEESRKYNYDCILACQYISNDASSSPVGGFIQEQEDFTSCDADNTDDGGESLSSRTFSTDQCVNGKCFHGDCVDKCTAMAADLGKTLTNIRVDPIADVVYCDLDGVMDSQGFPFYGPCELPNQLDFYGAHSHDGTDDGDSDVYFDDVVQPDAECKRRFGDDGVSARAWNNGCFFRCVTNGDVLVRRYIQPSGSNCGDKYSCVFAKCQKDTCIDSCNSIMAGGETLLDIIQENVKSDEADCYFKGETILNTVKLDSPTKCEANYPFDQDTDGGGRPMNGSIIVTSSNITGSFNTFNNNSNDNNTVGNNSSQNGIHLSEN